MAESPDREQRRRRRELLRRYHPDLGGDAEQFVRVLQSITAGRSPGSGTSASGRPYAAEVRFVRRPRGLARLPAWYQAWRRRSSSPPRVV